MDSWPRSVLQRRGWPNHEVPAPNTEQRFSVRVRANARTDKRTRRQCSSSECGTAAASRLKNPAHPSAGRIPPRVDTLACSSHLQWADFRTDQFVGLSPVQLVDAIQAAAKISEDSVLYLTAALGRGVWNTMKRHHGILGHKDLRILGLQRQFDLLAEKKTRIANAISHLDEVFYRHVGDGVGVCLRASSKSLKTRSQSGAWTSISSSRTVQSSNPQLIPCPKNGTMAWAASPSRSALPLACHGEHLTVTIAPVGLAKKVSSNCGIRENASGKRDWKNSRTKEGDVSCAKLSCPSKGRNRMQANVPSTLGKAINM